MTPEELMYEAEDVSFRSDSAEVRDLARVVMKMCRELHSIRDELAVKLDDPEYVIRPGTGDAEAPNDPKLSDSGPGARL